MLARIETWRKLIVCSWFSFSAVFSAVEVFFAPDNRPAQHLIKQLEQAKKRVWAAVYMLTDKKISQALIDAHARNVDVKLILDKGSFESQWGKTVGLSQAGITLMLLQEQSRSQNTPSISKAANISALASDSKATETQKSSVQKTESLPTVTSQKPAALGNGLSQRFAILDNSVWTGPFNCATCTGDKNKKGAAFVCQNSNTVQKYVERFKLLESLAGKISAQEASLLERQIPSNVLWYFSLLSGRPPLESFFSPVNVFAKQLVDRITQTKERAWVAVNLLSGKRVVQALIAAHARGVDVRIILDYNCLENPWGKTALLGRAGISVMVLLEHTTTQRTTDNGVVDGAVPEKTSATEFPVAKKRSFFAQPLMHNKFAIIDDNIWTGSFNWTVSANNKNRENALLITNDPESLQKYVAEFHFLESVTQKISAQQAEAMQRKMPAFVPKPRFNAAEPKQPTIALAKRKAPKRARRKPRRSKVLEVIFA